MAHKGSFRSYWAVYGGLWSLARSTYFWIAVLITVVAKPFWSALDAGQPKWVDLTITVIPSLLGFSLGGMAIMLAFSTGRFLEAIRQKGRDDSFFMKVVASFFHFTVVLGSALLIAIVSKALPSFWLSAIGFLSVYGITLAIAVIDHLWQTAAIFNKVRELADHDHAS